ncbi:MAG: glycosyltransferase family 4 protein [Gammaproteobacteria bacterium]|nr:glycosyltransferase family 4 protein [Gammaproteobacteria bacterium]
MLWVGRIAPVKRLELLLDVAERLPAVIFDVVGKPDAEPGYVTRVMDRARALRNVRVRGAVDPELMPEMYRSASILCCTSVYEGFPNTFLEAWSHGIPVVSTIDPDGLIASRHLGSTGGNADELATGIQRLVEAPDVWRRASADARLLFLEHFSAESAMPRFELMFAETIEGKRPSTRSRTHDPAGILGDDMGAPAKTRQR